MRVMVGLILLSVSCATWRSIRGEPSCEGGEANVIDHRVQLDVRFAPASLSGEGDLTLEMTRAASVISLDAIDLQLESAVVGDQPAKFSTTDGHLCIALPKPHAAGEQVTLSLKWKAKTDAKVPTFKSTQAWAGYATARWMPTVFDPAQRATLTLAVKVPAGHRVAASGEPVAFVAASGFEPRDIYSFRVSRPSPPFLFAWAAGELDEAWLTAEDGVKLRALGPPKAKLHTALELSAWMMHVLQTKTGARFPSATYQLALVDGDEAQEAAGLVLVSASALDDLARDPHDDWVFSHELAHQWFAWLVSCRDFSDFWLNEGFATFLVAVVKEEKWGRAAYEQEVATWRERSAKAHEQGKDAPVSLSPPGQPHVATPEKALQSRGITYFRGALVLDRLRTELGDDAFWRGVQAYVQQQADKPTTTEDLRAAMESASGKSLTAFFAEHVY